MMLYSEKLKPFTAAHPCEAVAVDGARYRYILDGKDAVMCTCLGISYTRLAPQTGEEKTRIVVRKAYSHAERSAWRLLRLLVCRRQKTCLKSTKIWADRTRNKKARSVPIILPVRTLLFYLLIVPAISNFLSFIEAVIRETVLKKAGFLFGSFLVRADIDKPLLEATVAFINLLGNRTAGICQMQKIVFYEDESTAFQM